VQGDQGRLSQVISNLLSNAIKFTDQGSVAIECVCLAIEAGRAKLELSVVDTGQGFDPSSPSACSSRSSRPTRPTPAAMAEPGWAWRSAASWSR
jgi:signal transduction histidine kinase